MRVCACMRPCVRASVRLCVCVCVCVRACLCACVHVCLTCCVYPCHCLCIVPQKVHIYLDYAADESYTPNKISVLGGSYFHDLQVSSDSGT